MKLFVDYLNRNKMDHKSYQFEGVEWCVGREKGIVEGECEGEATGWGE